MTGTVQAVRLPHRVASGSAQMGVDAALLAWAAAGPARLAYRTYGWSRPTLSLGRREAYPGDWDLDRLREEGVDVVRRPTGGDAVLHDDEVTFAVAASLPGPWRLTPRGFADAVADAVAEAAGAVGVEAERVLVADAPAGGGIACFARAARGEVRAGAFKIAGLASRFARGAALCHASVPLGTRYREVARYRRDGSRDQDLIARHARSIGELAGGTAPGGRAVEEAIAAALEARIGARLEPARFADLGIDGP